ncbi:Protein SRG1 [Ananas comosus]|uniref:Protein SRG1 n=1 Tax=Ananas comosus TaxID=4615 RepID=A0A199UPQ9_ANACO|nr:Protein SRG1 [Ananas comosus]
MGEETGRKHAVVQQLAADGRDPPSRYVAREEDRPIGDSSSPAPPRSGVPVVDLRRATGHEIPEALLDEVMNVSRAFFCLPIEEKQKYTNLIDGKEFKLEGYGNDRVASDDQILDWSDRLYLLVQPEGQRNLALWPETPASFREVLHEFTTQCKRVANRILRAMAQLLELDEDYFVSQFDEKAITFARFNYYPQCSRPDLVFGIKPHSDGSVMTILLPDKDVGGLQVLRDGEWVDVPTIPHTLLVNLGDGMEIMSNGTFKSPVHRVVTNAGKERLSVAMFYALDPERELGPAAGLIDEERPRLYKTVKTKDYLAVLFETFAKGKRAIDWAKV